MAKKIHRLMAREAFMEEGRGWKWEWRWRRLRFRRALVTAGGVLEGRDSLLVRALDPEKGTWGYGEGGPLPPFFGEHASGMEAVLAAEAGDRDPLSLAARIKREDWPCLRAAVEMVAEDGENHGPGRGVMLPSGTAELKVASLAGDLGAWRGNGDGVGRERFRRDRESGYRTFKLKVGVWPAPEEIAALERFLAELPARGRVRLDANGRLGDEVERWVSALADYGAVEFLEQPLPPGVDWAVWHSLAERLEGRIGLDESLSVAGGMEAARAEKWEGFWVVKPLVTGVGRALEERLGKGVEKCVLSSGFETAIGMRHLLRSALRLGIGRDLGLGTEDYLVREEAGWGIDGPGINLQTLFLAKAGDYWEKTVL